MRIILSMAIWAASTIFTILLYFVMLFTSLVFFTDRKREITHAQCFWWSRILININPYWTVDVSGLENIDKRKNYVIVANHQSLTDIVVLYRTRMQFKWVAKESLFRVPFIGWNLGLARHIKLRRGDFSSIKNVYHEAATWLRDDMSVLFFPEGTRSETGKMKEFQNGAFKLAIKEKKPVLPIALRGTGDTIQKGSWLFNPKVRCLLKVLPAIETKDFQAGDFGRLRDVVHSKLSENI